MKFFKSFFNLLKKAYFSWNRNEPYARSATIAYYAIFSLPSLLIIVVTVASSMFEREAVQGRITDEIGEFVGEEAALSIEKMITNAAVSTDSTIAIIIGIAILLFGATGVFFQLKRAMNNIWNIAEKKTNIVQMLIDRLISFGMVLVIGLLLLISLTLSAILTFFKDTIEGFAPTITGTMIDLVNFSFSFIIITTLFAAIFKLLPDVKIRWRITYLGAALTTILFLIGESLIAFYFGKSEPGSIYGGASTVILVMLWVYYTCLILFYGAEFTVQYALHKNEKVVPGRYGEPAIYQEMDKLKQKRVQLKEDKKIFDALTTNLDIDPDDLEDYRNRREKEKKEEEKDEEKNDEK